MLARKKQGWINYYRKPFLIVGIITFLSIWFFTNPYFSLSDELIDLMEGIGSILLFIGVIGRVFSSFTIASHKNEKIIDRELYSIIRHPLYFFSFFMALGIGFLTGRFELIALILVVFFLCFYPMIINEESYLEEKFGKEYTEYKKRVPRFIPRFKKWKTSNEITINLKLVTKTLMDAFLGLLIIPFIELIEYIIYMFK